MGAGIENRWENMPRREVNMAHKESASKNLHEKLKAQQCNLVLIFHSFT